MTHDPADLSGLTLAEKASLSSGADFWTTKAVGDVPSLVLTDGPHGVRRQAGATDHLGLAESLPATCFPPAVGLSQSWDPDLVGRVGAALGAEAGALGVDVLLGPGINIKRDPRGGRNFEYFSEDPLLTGVLGGAWVSGLQSTGVGASLKHFAANNAEHDRMRSSSNVDPRTLREIYLRAFQRVVRTSAPWTVMCSYNRINGVYASEDHWLLTTVLRQEWGFDGVVVSDWGAVQDRPAAVAAGLDLEMPGDGGASDARLLAAVEAGACSTEDVDTAASRVAALAARARGSRRDRAADPERAPEVGAREIEDHHALAREVAARCVVLLKNDGALLPLAPDGSVAVIGGFARNPRYQGGGSSHVNPTRVDVPLEEIRALAGSGAVAFAPGYADRAQDGTEPGDAAALREEAVRAASEADTAVVFLGLAEHQESEGFDREHIELPAEQLDLLAAVVRAQPRTVVVLSHGGVLRLAPVAELAPAVLDGALLGQAGGGAIADVLFGRVNPSGRLGETVPVRLQDTPAYLNFPGENSAVLYGEGLYVGYRWYDARDMEVAFPFGHGLSYTSFAYSDLELEQDGAGITAHLTVTNTGDRSGREVVQFYVAKPDSAVSRAPRELKGFTGVTLEPGRSERVSVPLSREDLAYWEVRADRWVVEGGEYVVSAGASSRDLRVTAAIAVEGDALRLPVTLDSTLGEVMADPGAAALLAQAFTPPAAEGSDNAMGMDMARMMASIPIRRLASFGPTGLDELEALVARINAED
ncbi:glycoside hydrolase family 3 C-terminal domain-containing protein [Nocardiopsis dassonvillei]|uniref:Exo-alpha-(1->6)-L-arabinopyranosidase n=1 Tax=Nocardiopsis dassonvillei (strain ATCC 23218 / DSM 43111 / CIP 107115 / JCM 7437 / KCTC 9190 / NBRC 14626 / NCTC 10488 / NRRL B-5397 / IMRU 509) TaxID=446468 RepID=D7B174_NOCDD|nr:glycoside hydrolase family 3 C-terminal domain-containing protein [Nocardiopsis dassonvillei]ADH66465.1 glycoside hydrolase family 3 domain protein [Nocardiopsis dassonvillei subsp. dassonvillei DSM 43111]NKY77796.1 glycosyl hydrolase [Nocardiopsis dassonvillei]VEI92486.1 Thermostable beta-glucosidase B [Nocardiopsis dassonvillei]